jgi:hypothetical protein
MAKTTEDILHILTAEQRAVLLHRLLEDWEAWEKELREWTKEDVVVEDEETGEIDEPDGDDELVQRTVWATGGMVRQFLRKHLR